MKLIDPSPKPFASLFSPTRDLMQLTGRSVLPLLTFVCIAALATLLGDPVAVRESLFLALWAGAGVAAITAVSWPTTGRGREVHWPAATALLAVLASWVGHHQPYRGATVAVILIVGLSLALASAWRQRLLRLGLPVDPTDAQPTESPEAAEAAPDYPRLGAELTVPAALAFQLLLRPDLLLLPYFEARTLVSLLALPSIAGIALAVLGERFDARRVALAGAVTAILGPGFNVTTTCALLALAAGSLFTRQDRPAWLRWLALAGLAALPWWLGNVGLLFALAGLSLALTSTAGILVLISVGAIAILAPQARDRVSAFFMFIAALGLVPSAVLTTPQERGRMRQGGLIALAAAMICLGPESMAAGLALLALSVPVRSAIFEVQRAWTTIVLLGTCVFAAYPWLRAEPRGALLRQLGLEPRGTDLVLPFVLVVGLGFVLHLVRQMMPRFIPRTSWIVLGFLAWALLQGPKDVTVLRTSYQAMALTSQDFLLRQAFEAQPVRGVIVDSNLVHGLKLPAGTVVADVVLRDADNRQIFSWPLKVGVHTAEWAVSRPNLEQSTDLQIPHPWVSQVAPSGTFFSHRFRGRFLVAEALQAAHVHIVRRDDLPDDVQLVLYRLELRR